MVDASRELSHFTRRSFRLEAWSTLCFAAALAFIEGGTIAVLLKHTFAGMVGARWHYMAVALAGGANEIANLVSFGWIAASHGRSKVRFINGLQIAMVALVAAVALMPRSPAGLWGTLALVISARVCWSGIVTLRSNIWRANYPPHARAKMVGRLSVITQITLAVLGLGISAMMDHDLGSYHWLAPLLAAVAMCGVFAYSKLRARGERSLLAAERVTPRAAGVMRPWGGVASTIKVLRQDKRFAQFMACMFVLGFGNLMVTPVVVIALGSRFDLGAAANKTSVLATTTVPYLLMPLTVPIWAMLLDRSHVVRFRAIHGWTFVFATGFFVLGLWTRSLPLVYVGSIFWGIGLGGGSLAWNLGHVDFAPPSQTSHYMATHVTLNGVRGLLAPLVSTGLYNACCDEHGAPALGVEPGALVMMVSAALTTAGCAGFVALDRAMGKSFAKRS